MSEWRGALRIQSEDPTPQDGLGKKTLGPWGGLPDETDPSNRHVYISAEFQKEHPAAADFLKSQAGLPADGGNARGKRDDGGARGGGAEEGGDGRAY